MNPQSLRELFGMHRDLVSRLVDILGCTRYQAAQILRRAVREGYKL